MLALTDFFPSYMVGPHAFTYCVWVAILVTIVTETHAGFEFPFSPFPGWADAHYVGCFGMPPFWDRVMGTDDANTSWKETQ